MNRNGDPYGLHKILDAGSPESSAAQDACRSAAKELLPIIEQLLDDSGVFGPLYSSLTDAPERRDPHCAAFVQGEGSRLRVEAFVIAAGSKPETISTSEIFFTIARVWKRHDLFDPHGTITLTPSAV